MKVNTSTKSNRPTVASVAQAQTAPNVLTMPSKATATPVVNAAATAPTAKPQAADDPAVAAAMAEIARLKAENAALRQAQPKRERHVTLKVSEKGAVSVYGLGRFPVTLYAEQWEALLGIADAIRDFISANRSKLAVKGEAQAKDGGQAQ